MATSDEVAGVSPAPNAHTACCPAKANHHTLIRVKECQLSVQPRLPTLEMIGRGWK